jgi:hypothetical protein
MRVICKNDGTVQNGVMPDREEKKMRLRLISAAFAITIIPAAANAQLTIDMGLINCAQYLAMSPSMSRNFSAWMSGWFSYQTRRTFIDLGLHQKNIASLKAWCQYHPQALVMTGLKEGLQNAIGPQ